LTLDVGQEEYTQSIFIQSKTQSLLTLENYSGI